MLNSTNPTLAASIANELTDVFSSQVKTIQAERFSVSKESLQAQIKDMEDQIDQATADLQIRDRSRYKSQPGNKNHSVPFHLFKFIIKL